MKYRPISIFKNATAFIAVSFLSITAFAQSVTVGSGAAAPGAAATISVDYTESVAPAVTNFNFSILFDETQLTPDLTNCGGVNAAVANATISCGMTPGSVNIVALNLTPTASGTGTLGTIDFTIDGGVAPGTVLPLMVAGEVYSDPLGMPVPSAGSTDGAVTAEIAGSSFYSSVPVVGDDLDFGQAVIDGTSVDGTVTITNASSDTDFDVTAATGTATVGTATITSDVAAAATVIAGGTLDVVFTCEPGARGANTGTLAIANDSDNEGPSAAYTFTCDGLAPNIALAPTPINLMGVSGGPAVTGTFDITNVQDGFTSDALNAVLSSAPDAPEITITDGLADGTISVDETDSVEVSCASAVASPVGTPFTETVTLTWDSPLGGTATADVVVNCTVVDEIAEYASAPAPGSTITFDDVLINTTSAPMDINVSNIDTDAVPNAVLNIADGGSVNTAGTAVIAATINEAAIAIGDDLADAAEISVTCAPTEVGQTTSTLTITSDDVDGVSPATATPHTYTVVCNAINEVAEYVSVPADGSTIDFGAVVNGTTSPALGVDIGNTDTDAIPNGTLTIASATIAGPDAAVFTLMTDPTGDTFAAGVAPDGTNDAEVTCTPTDGTSSFAATLSIASNDPDSPATYPLACGAAAGSGFVSDPVEGSLVDFGAPVAGETVTQTILVSNGDASVDDLIITSCEIVGDNPEQFVLVNPAMFPVTIAALDPPVAFDIDATAIIGGASAVLECVTNDPAVPVASFDLFIGNSAVEVPTLSRFGLIALIMTLMMGGFIAFRLRQS